MLTHLPPELVCYLSNFLLPLDCFSLKLTCRYLHNILQNINDKLEARYIYSLENISHRDRMLDKLVKGTEWIHQNNPSWNNNYILIWYIKTGRTNKAMELLEEGKIDPSLNSRALQFSASHGYLELVNKILEDSRVDPSVNKNCALVWAADNGHYDVMERLLLDERVEKKMTVQISCKIVFARVIKRKVIEKKKIEFKMVECKRNGNKRKLFTLQGS